MRHDVLHGDCRELLRGLAADSLDSCVTDPPYALGFMGRGWDTGQVAFDVETWRAVLRVLKPGAHLVAFGGERTVHRLACAIEDAGFEIRHQGVWVSAQSFPKSMDVSKAIDAAAGAEREVVGPNPHARPSDGRYDAIYAGAKGHDSHITAPATPDAAEWSGWGTALKTMEPYVLARKPLSERTVAANVLRWGTGALNIDGCRLPFAGESIHAPKSDPARRTGATFQVRSGDDSALRMHAAQAASIERLVSMGRWPASVMVADLDVQGPAGGVEVKGEARDPGAANIAARRRSRNERRKSGTARGEIGVCPGGDGLPIAVDGTALDGVLGPYTRHFRIPGTDGEHDEALAHLPDDLAAAVLPTMVVCPKASPGEREEGLGGFEAGRWSDGREKPIDNPRLRMTTGRRNVHPTVKPIALMRHLVRLVTPRGGTVLDLFTGSGSTGVAATWEGCAFVGCELNDTENEPYVRIARARIAYAERTPPPELRPRVTSKEEKIEAAGQGRLL